MPTGNAKPQVTLVFNSLTYTSGFTTILTCPALNGEHHFFPVLHTAIDDLPLASFLIFFCNLTAVKMLGNDYGFMCVRPLNILFVQPFLKEI